MIGPDDVFRSNFFAAASYLAASAEADERVRKGLLAQSAQMFLHPKQPTVLGCGAAKAIANSGDKGALYLPQVAVDEGWDLEQMLVNLCRKAGLADDAWQGEEARFYVFGGQWFGEE